MEDVLGYYVLKRDRMFDMYDTAVRMVEGSEVVVCEYDSEKGRVLIDFGGGYNAWYPIGILRDFEKDVVVREQSKDSIIGSYMLKRDKKFTVRGDMLTLQRGKILSILDSTDDAVLIDFGLDRGWYGKEVKRDKKFTVRGDMLTLQCVTENPVEVDQWPEFDQHSLYAVENIDMNPDLLTEVVFVERHLYDRARLCVKACEGIEDKDLEQVQQYRMMLTLLEMFKRDKKETAKLLGEIIKSVDEGDSNLPKDLYLDIRNIVSR